MIPAADFQRICNEMCDRLARDTYDPGVFDLMHAPEFMLACAWLGIDPDKALQRISQIAAERRKLASADCNSPGLPRPKSQL